MTEPFVAAAQDRSGEARWELVLDELEAVIGRQRDAFDAGATEADALAVMMFVPPDDLPPLPAALEARARRLLAQTSELIGRARSMSERLEPRGAGVHQRAARRAPATFDRRA